MLRWFVIPILYGNVLSIFQRKVEAENNLYKRLTTPKTESETTNDCSILDKIKSKKAFVFISSNLD